MQIKFKVPDEDSDDDEVYPLSIKYEKNKVWKSNIYRFFFLFLIIICLILSNFYTDNAGKTLSERTGYFADQIYEKTISMSGINEYKVNTQNCIVYLLENKGSTSEIKVYASVSRSTSVSFSLSSSIETIFLFLIIICLILSNFYTDNAGKTLSERTGYFADQIYEKTISINIYERNKWIQGEYSKLHCIFTWEQRIYLRN